VTAQTAKPDDSWDLESRLKQLAASLQAIELQQERQAQQLEALQEELRTTFADLARAAAAEMRDMVLADLKKDRD
jgi:chaperonin cofactor prefoldin